MMNMVKQARMKLGLSQAELAAELSKTYPGIDRSLISKLEMGYCEPTASVREWLLKACEQPFDGSNEQRWTTLRESEKKLLKTELQTQIYSVLESCSEDNPATRRMLRIKTGRSDRVNRRAIEEMRAEGILITSSSSWYGYWLARTDRDVRILTREYTSRLRKILKILRVIQSICPNQLVMEVYFGEGLHQA